MAVNSVNNNSASAAATAAACSEVENKTGAAEVYFQRGQNLCHLTCAHLHTQFPHSADVLIPGENVQTQINSCTLSPVLGSYSSGASNLCMCFTFLTVPIDQFAQQKDGQLLWLCLCLFKMCVSMRV